MKLKRWRKPRNYFLVLSFILELIAIILIFFTLQSSCIQGRETASVVELFMILVGQFVLPDFIFSILICMDSKNSIRPFALVYSVYATVMCGIGTVLLLIGLRFCGNWAQFHFLFAAICGILATASHFGSIYEVGMGMQKTEKFAMNKK